MRIRSRGAVGLSAALATVMLLASPAVAQQRHGTHHRHATHRRHPHKTQLRHMGRHRYIPFAPPAYWSQEIGVNAPTDGSSAAIIAFLKADNANNYITLSGTTSDGRWGTPVYNAVDGDPTYSIVNSCQYRQPPEFRTMRIPVGARPDSTTDASMVVYDVSKGLEYALWHASFDPSTGHWSACGGTVYYLASNGIVGTLKESNERRNYGHRGVPPSTYAVTYREISDGSINHLLRIAVNTTKCAHVFPMSGDECGTYAAGAPPEGTIIRIKQSVNLEALGLTGAALVVARALQDYGAIIGDQSGASVELKVENTVAEGRGWLWNGLLTSTALSKIPLDYYEVVKLGYGA